MEDNANFLPQIHSSLIAGFQFCSEWQCAFLKILLQAPLLLRVACDTILDNETKVKVFLKAVIFLIRSPFLLPSSFLPATGMLMHYLEIQCLFTTLNTTILRTKT